MNRSRFAMGLLAWGLLSGCGNGRGPSAAVDPAAREPHESVLPASGTNETAPGPEPAPAPAGTSAEPVANQPAPPPVGDDAPVIDCSKYPAGKAPNVRWLCEVAMAPSQSALLDANGFAYVTEFESPEDSRRDGHDAKRLCGVAAEERLKELARTVRYELALPEADGPFVTCAKHTCELMGMGEWSTNTTLVFRSGKSGPVLDAWSEIEIVLVDPVEVDRRAKAIAAGLKKMAKAGCSP